jgi:hypothetical protein
MEEKSLIADIRRGCILSVYYGRDWTRGTRTGVGKELIANPFVSLLCPEQPKPLL